MKKYTALEIRGDDWLRGKDFVLASEYVLLEKERDILEQQCVGLGNVQAERDTLRTRVAKLEKVLRWVRVFVPPVRRNEIDEALSTGITP